MFRLSRTSVIAWTAVVAVIPALSYTLTGVAVPRAAAEDKAKPWIARMNPIGPTPFPTVPPNQTKSQTVKP